MATAIRRAGGLSMAVMLAVTGALWSRAESAELPIPPKQAAKPPHALRRVCVGTDGRAFPAEIEPTWIGTSIGHWDGDTFVVETRGFNGKTNLDTAGHQHSDQMHLTQRFTRTDEKHMAYEVIIDDPILYTKPWKNVRTFTLRPDWELMEYSCMENNKDLLDGHIK